jgi:hypothetical protein
MRRELVKKDEGFLGKEAVERGFWCLCPYNGDDQGCRRQAYCSINGRCTEVAVAKVNVNLLTITLTEH